MTTTHPTETTPTEFVKSAGRPVPAWFNIDVLVDVEELVEIEAIRTEVRAFVREAVVLAERARWALSITNRFDYDVDESHFLFSDALGTDEMLVMASAMPNLFEGTIGDDTLAAIEKGHGAAFPELIEALHKIQGENVNGAPDRGSFEVPRNPAATPEVGA